MEKLIFYWPHNSLLKRDGDEFTRCALEYKDYSSRRYIIPKKSKLKRRQYMLELLGKLKNTNEKFDRFAFFCHGWPKSFDAGYSVENIGMLGRRLAAIANHGARVYLFCCKTGKLEDGLAAKLSLTSGLPVFAHSTSGHTTRNPFKHVFTDGWRTALFPPVKDKELWAHHKKEVAEDPFGFLERVEL